MAFLNILFLVGVVGFLVLFAVCSLFILVRSTR